MKLRAIGGVAAGIVVWYLLFWFLGMALGQLWPDYRAAARLYFASGDFSGFTVPMMALNGALFAACGLGAGLLVGRIARLPAAGSAFGGLLFVYAAVSHFWWLWGNLPDWYNLVIPWVIGGSAWLGARAYRQPSVQAQ